MILWSGDSDSVLCSNHTHHTYIWISLLQPPHAFTLPCLSGVRISETRTGLVFLSGTVSGFNKQELVTIFQRVLCSAGGKLLWGHMSAVSACCQQALRGFKENPCRIQSRRTPVESFIQTLHPATRNNILGNRIGERKTGKTKNIISNKLDTHVQLNCLKVKTQQGGKCCYITLRPHTTQNHQFSCSLIVSFFLLRELNQWEPYNLKWLVVGSISGNRCLVSFFHECSLCCKHCFSAPV